MTTATRRGFERLYDLPERVLPPDVLALPTPSREEADLELVRRAARSHGVASLRCLADYYRTLQAPAKVAVTVISSVSRFLTWANSCAITPAISSRVRSCSRPVVAATAAF